jgi:hypothetical protein
MANRKFMTLSYDEICTGIEKCLRLCDQMSLYSLMGDYVGFLAERSTLVTKYIDLSD